MDKNEVWAKQTNTSKPKPKNSRMSVFEIEENLFLQEERVREEDDEVGEEGTSFFSGLVHFWKDDTSPFFLWANPLHFFDLWP